MSAAARLRPIVLILAVLLAGAFSTAACGQQANAAPHGAAAKNQLEAALQKKVNADFDNAELAKAVEALAKQAGVSIRLDEEQLDNYGLAADTPVSLRADGISLGAALNHLLRPLELAWLAQDQSLVVTTREYIDENLVSRIYNVRDLLADDGATMLDETSLVELIQTVVAPETWAESGGPGTISPFRKMLLVSQSHSTHARIDGLIAGLRRLSRQYKEHPESAVIEPIDLTDRFDDEHVWRALNRKIDRIAFMDKPLDAVAARLTELAGVPVIVDWWGLEQAGIGFRPAGPGAVEPDPFGGGADDDPFSDAPADEAGPFADDDPFGIGGDEPKTPEPQDDPFGDADGDPFGALVDSRVWFCALNGELRITYAGEDLTLRSALQQMLEPHNLTWMVLHEAITITTPEEREFQLPTRVYPVRDLARDENGLFDPSACDTLTNLNTNSIAPDSWDFNGGPGSVSGFKRFGIVVSQTLDHQAQVADALAQLRAEVAKNQAAAKADDAPQDGMVLRVYFVAPHAQGLVVATDENAKLVDIIRALVAPQSWQEKDGPFINKFQTSLVVRHRVEVHREIEKLLAKLNVAWQTRPYHVPHVIPFGGGSMPGVFGGGMGGGGFGGGGMGGGEGGMGGGFFNAADTLRPIRE